MEKRPKSQVSEKTDSIEYQTLPPTPGYENRPTSSRYPRTMHKSDHNYQKVKHQSPSKTLIQDNNKFHSQRKAYSVPKFGHHGPFANRTMSYNVMENKPSLQSRKSKDQDCFYNETCKKLSKCSSKMYAKLESVKYIFIL